MVDFKIDFLDEYSDESIADELRRIAKSLGSDTVTKQEIKSYGKISYSVVYKHFGSLRRALEFAGLNPQRYMKATEAELLRMILVLWETTLEKEGRTPQRKDLKTYNFPVSGDTYTRRFGSWKKALIRAYESVNTQGLDEEDINRKPRKEEKFKKSRALSLRKRFFVLKRDDFTCRICGASGHGVKLEVDHIIPVAKGGSDALDNLRTLCFKCNRGKRDSI